jgi:hypothetical protein
VAAVFEAKGRPHFNPLICHFPDAEAAFAEVIADDRARALAAAFWPGPLTLVLPRRPECRIDLLAGAGLDTLAVRVPAHPLALELLRAAAIPVAGPSANRSGAVSPTTADHVLEGLTGCIAAVLDGGSSARFSRHLLRGKQLAASASASYSALSRLEDLFSLDGTPREGVSLAQLEAAMREEILEIQRQPPTAEELARVKTQVRAQTIYQQDSLFYQAMTIGALDAVGLPWQLKDRYDAAIAAVTPAQVQAAAKKYLVSERSTVAWLSSAGAAP